jgi:uncharacterized membrane protein
LVKKFSFLERIGSIVLVYIVGIIIGNIDILPQDGSNTLDLITSVTIPLAIPLLIFSFNIKSWLKMAKTTFISLIVTVISVVLIVIISTFIFNDQSEDYWKIPGMLVGVYTGGTPNLASIKTALNVDNQTYILTHSFDMVFSSAYLLFLMIAGQKFFGLFLPKFSQTNASVYNQENLLESDHSSKRHNFISSLFSILAAAMVLAIGGGLSMIVRQEYAMIVAIISITTLGVLGSFIPKINQLKHSFDLGMYFILVFSMAVASMADFSNFSIDSVYLFLNIGFVVFGSIILQLIFSKIFNIDRDTTIICSTALICSPPFVPVIAGSIKNKELIFSGLTIGIIGYVIGNYLGILVAFALK